jgi:hypothetical protein
MPVDRQFLPLVQARDHFHRKVRLSMALSWLSLARDDEAALPSGSSITGSAFKVPATQES